MTGEAEELSPGLQQKTQAILTTLHELLPGQIKASTALEYYDQLDRRMVSGFSGYYRSNVHAIRVARALAHSGLAELLVREPESGGVEDRSEVLLGLTRAVREYPSSETLADLAAQLPTALNMTSVGPALNPVGRGIMGCIVLAALWCLFRISPDPTVTFLALFISAAIAFTAWLFYLYTPNKRAVQIIELYFYLRQAFRRLQHGTSSAGVMRSFNPPRERRARVADPLAGVSSPVARKLLQELAQNNAVENALSDDSDLRRYTYWLRERLRQSGLAQRLISEEELQPHPQSLHLIDMQMLLPVKKQSLAQRAQHVADNLNHYVGAPERYGLKNDPVLRSFAIAGALLAFLMLSSMTFLLGAPLALAIILGVGLGPLLILIISLRSKGGELQRSAVNRREFYAYLLESYSDPPEPSTRPVRTGHRPRQRLR